MLLQRAIVSLSDMSLMRVIVNVESGHLRIDVGILFALRLQLRVLLSMWLF